MNPYAPILRNRDPLQVVRSTPGRLAELLDQLGQEGAKRSLAPGKWSVREIICHLADCELVFAFRLRQTLAETHHVIQPFDQEKWAAAYGAFDAATALEVFTIVRKWNVKLVDSLRPDALSKPVTHPERGDMTFQVLLETMAGHDLNHQRQIETIAGEATAAATRA